MKYIIASLAIGACLVLPSAEAVFAAQPGADCGSVGVAPGNSTGAVNPAGTNGSPYASDTTTSTFTKNYAGSGTNPTASPTHPNSPHAVSQYDIACVNVSTTPGHKSPLAQTP